MCQHLAKVSVQVSLSPEETRQSARVWLKMSTSAFAARTLRTNLTLATSTKKPARKARIVEGTAILPPIIFAL